MTATSLKQATKYQLRLCSGCSYPPFLNERLLSATSSHPEGNNDRPQSALIGATYRIDFVLDSSAANALAQESPSSDSRTGFP